jgi:hypothetical protein
MANLQAGKPPGEQTTCLYLSMGGRQIFNGAYKLPAGLAFPLHMFLPNRASRIQPGYTCVDLMAQPLM